MEQESCQSEPLPSDQSELDDSQDSAFAKTPIRADSVSGEDDDGSSCGSNSSSSSASPHCNEQGNRTYFHVWGDMLTCKDMSLLDEKAADEVPNYVEGDEEANPNIHRPLSIDTSLPCPLIQFGPVPKRRSARNPKPATAEAAVADASNELAGDVGTAAAASSAAGPLESGHNHDDGAGSHGHDERCCDFSVVAAKNKARLRREERLRKKEQRKLIRY